MSVFSVKSLRKAGLSSVLESARNVPSPSSLQQSSLTKRQHALFELLSSEREFASDMALIRDVHLPLALGQPNRTPASSSSSNLQIAPMSSEDVRIIFSNIAELAVFSNAFCDSLEDCLGSSVSGGESYDDRVGALFLEIMPELEKVYKHYIKNHPVALLHLQSLPLTHALTNALTHALQSYLKYTRAVASHHSYALDLASLLIKPVQRLHKYSFLLGAIIDETPKTHADKAVLRMARMKVEALVHDINERRRRVEVVKNALGGEKKNVGLGMMGVTGNVARMKILKLPGPGSEGGPIGSAGVAEVGGDGNGNEAALLKEMHVELKRIDVFVQQLGKNVVDWARMMSDVVKHLRIWVLGFGKMIGLLGEQGVESEAFDAFMAVVEGHLLPLAQKLESDVNEKLLKVLARLLVMTDHPLKLLVSMEEHEPFHYHLSKMDVSPMNRPAPELLEASTNYLALRGQLAMELPTYMTLLRKGLEMTIEGLAKLQARFWREVRNEWADLWEMLRVEGEMKAGHEETMAVWQARWEDVDEVVAGLRIIIAPRVTQMSAAKVDTYSLIQGAHKPSPKPKLTQRIWPLLKPWSSHVSSAKGQSLHLPALLPRDEGSPSLSSPSSSSTVFDDADHDAPTVKKTSRKSRRQNSWDTKQGKYTCRVVHVCKPPKPVSYYGFPFFTLSKGDLYEVLQEAGHPSVHPKLPLHVDDGEDCLMLCRNVDGEVGWALASFLEPVEGPKDAYDVHTGLGDV